MKIADLIASYRADPASSYHALRYRTRQHYDSLLRVIDADLGERDVTEIRTRDLKLIHQTWSLRGVAMAHALVSMLRTLCSFGMVLMEDNDCVNLSTKMSAMRFPMAKPRKSRLTYEQVVAIRAEARRQERYSIALAQAFQFEGTLRQRDVIGEWIPECEPGESDVHDNGFKWLRGLRWSEIDDKLILRHVTSKRNKEVEINLNLAPMVMAELRFEFLIPASAPRIRAGGPVIVSEETGLPYSGHEFRRLWRLVARAAGVPDDTFNMDSRSGAITEAFMSGANPEAVRKSATHSALSTTSRYSRGDADEIAEVMRLRVASRSAV